MASAAIPVLFPPQVINSVFDLPLQIKEGTYAEGTTYGLYNNFRKQLKKLNQEYGTIDELFILSPQRDFATSHNHRHNFSAMNRNEWEEYEDFLERVSLNGFLEFLLEMNEANRKKKYARTINPHYSSAEEFGIKTLWPYFLGEWAWRRSKNNPGFCQNLVGKRWGSPFFFAQTTFFWQQGTATPWSMFFAAVFFIGRPVA